MSLHRLEKRSLSKLTASPLERARNSSFRMSNPSPGPLVRWSAGPLVTSPSEILTELVPDLSSTREYGQKKEPLTKWKHLAKGTKSVYEP